MELDNLRIVGLRVENFKRVTAVSIRPDGNVVHITGKNGSGKSSLLDSIEAALLGGKSIPDEPIRAGERRSEVALDFGVIVVTRTMLEGKKPTLTVTSPAGAKFSSPQAMIEELMGKSGVITFDPPAFSRMEPAAQFEMLRKLVDIDVDIRELDVANENDYATRTEVNKEIKKIEGMIASATQGRDPLRWDGLPAEPYEVSALSDELVRAMNHNTALAREIEEREKQDKLYHSLKADKARLEHELEMVNSRLKIGGEVIEARPTLAEPLDTLALRNRISTAERDNALVRERDQIAAARAELDTQQAKSQSLTDAMNARKQEKFDALGRAKMPVEGLAFGDNELRYGAAPFSQASSADKIRVSCALAMGLPTKVKVLRIKDGSLLDSEGMKIVTDMCTAANWQVWIETVERGDIGFEMVDGSVRDPRVVAQDAATK